MDSKAPSQSLRESLFNEPVFTTDEVAKALGIQKTTVRDKIRRGELLALPMGRSYLITQTALRSFKRNLELRAILAQRQAQEPERGWELTACISCGESPVLTTSHLRLDGVDVLCESCARTVKGPDGADSLTKDAWERLVVVQVAERNHLATIARQQLQKEDPSIPDLSLLPWQVEHCPLCTQPYLLPLTAILDPDFYPACDHTALFAQQTQPLHISQPDKVLLRHLAHIEKMTRNWLFAQDPEDSYWQTITCTFCGELPAVTNEPMRLIGYAMCRSCARDKYKPPDDDTPFAGPVRAAIPALQTSLIEKALHVYASSHKLKFESRTCCWHIGDVRQVRECGSFDLFRHHSDGKEEIELSWCINRPVHERKHLAQLYISEHNLGEVFASRLLLEVEHALSSTSPDLDDLLRGRSLLYRRRGGSNLSSLQVQAY